MTVVVVLVVVAIAVGGLVTFGRAVFGGNTSFGDGRRRRRGRSDDDGGRGPRVVSHAGASHVPGSSSYGQWGSGSGL